MMTIEREAFLLKSVEGGIPCLILMSSWSVFCNFTGFCIGNTQQFLKTQGWLLLAILRFVRGFQITIANKTVNDLSMQS